jgi:hypothetical protein
MRSRIWTALKVTFNKAQLQGSLRRSRLYTGEVLKASLKERMLAVVAVDLIEAAMPRTFANKDVLQDLAEDKGVDGEVGMDSGVE